jgi:Protein phosphatase 2C
MSRNGKTGSSAAQRWRVRGVSVQGYSHLRDGVECQDAYRHTFSESMRAHVLAVADGAGSRARSAEGAALAVGFATTQLAERLQWGGVPDSAESWRVLLSEGCEEVVSTFVKNARRLGSDPGDFASTLTAVVLAYPWLGVLGVGDGFVIARADGQDGADTFHLVSSADSTGEYVNETVFLTSTGALAQANVACLYDPGLTAVMLGTDGLTPAAIRRNGATGRANRSFLEPLLDSVDSPTEIARFLLDDRISSLSADDKTLLMAVGT